eukprot:scaffold702_cov387-Prasinococcus_capsulatus_cf.AAC.3
MALLSVAGQRDAQGSGREEAEQREAQADGQPQQDQQEAAQRQMPAALLSGLPASFAAVGQQVAAEAPQGDAQAHSREGAPQERPPGAQHADAQVQQEQRERASDARIAKALPVLWKLKRRLYQSPQCSFSVQRGWTSSAGSAGDEKRVRRAMLRQAR